MPGIGLAPGGPVAPWRWKTSATSSLGRRTAAGLRPLSRPPSAERREPVERAGYRADRGVGDARVKRRGIELGVAEQHPGLRRGRLWITRMSVSCSKRWVAKLCRSVCGATRFLIPAASAAAWTARLSWRVESGSIGLRPGNSQPCGSSTPSRRPSRHQARRSSSSCGDSMACRSLRPLPRSTRSSMRSESISPTLSATTSETRSPAPYAVASAALYFGPGAAWSSSVTSSTLSTAGNRRGSRTMVSRRARSGRSSVYGEEETQGRDRTVDAWWLHAGLRLVQLEAAQILRRRRVGRPADEGCERPHVANVVIARLLSEAAYPHVLDHARPQRADRPVRRMGGHRELLSQAGGCWTFDARDRMPQSSRLTAYRLAITRKNLPTATRVIPRERVRCVPGMLNSSEVKFLYPT